MRHDTYDVERPTAECSEASYILGRQRRKRDKVDLYERRDAMMQ
jgi:hypothetical protein